MHRAPSSAAGPLSRVQAQATTSPSEAIRPQSVTIASTDSSKKSNSIDVPFPRSARTGSWQAVSVPRSRIVLLIRAVGMRPVGYGWTKVAVSEQIDLSRAGAFSSLR